MPPPANWITIEQAIQRFSDAGVPRKLRTVQKYCTNGRLSSHLALTDVGFKYFVDPASIEAFIAREAQMAPLSSDSDLDDGTAPARTAAQPHAQPRPDAPAHDDAPQPAASRDDLMLSMDMVRLADDLTRDPQLVLHGPLGSR